MDVALSNALSRGITALAVIAFVGIASGVQAAPGKARVPGQSWYEQGRALFDAGDYGESAKAFETGFRLAKLPGFLVNAGLAYERAGDRASAAHAYGRALAHLPEGPTRESVLTRIVRLGSTKPAAASIAAEAPTSSPTVAPPAQKPSETHGPTASVVAAAAAPEQGSRTHWWWWGLVAAGTAVALAGGTYWLLETRDRGGDCAALVCRHE